MNASNDQLAALRSVALGLGELRSEVVLVGGAAVGLLVTDPGAGEARPTLDVDLIVEVTTRVRYYENLRKRLLLRGFREDTSPSAPLCRWLLAGQPVDIMPTDPAVLGFSNAWYPHALSTARRIELASYEDDEVELRVVSAPSFLATKLASFASRGGQDLLHHDIEDIVTVVDGRSELMHELEDDSRELREFVGEGVSELFRLGLEDRVSAHLPGDAASQAREPFVLSKLRRIAKFRESGT